MPVNRRAEYAEATRTGIVDAARELFAERGFFATKVDDIAAAARVAPATVYAVGGGKQGLLRTLIELWTTAPSLDPAYARVEASDDPAAILHQVAADVRAMREEWVDVMRVVWATAPHDEQVREGLDLATARYRDGLAVTARRLGDLGALADGLDVPAAADMLWFWFGYSSYETLTAQNGWTYDRAQQWLADQAVATLLRP